MIDKKLDLSGISFRLQALMKERGYELDDVHRSTNIPPSHIMKTLQGMFVPTYQQIQKYSAAFDSTPDFIVYGLKSDGVKSYDFQLHIDDPDAHLFSAGSFK